MDERNLILTKNDIRAGSFSKTPEQLGVGDFKISLKRIYEAETIVYLEDESYRIITFKSRYHNI